MKKTMLFLLLLCLASSFMFSQKNMDIELIRKGNSLLQAKHYNEAEIAYRKALAANAKNSTAAYNLGVALQLQNKIDEAISQYTNAVQLLSDPRQKAAAYHNLGNAYCAKKEWAKAIEQYKSALRLNPSDMDTKYNLAFAQKKLQQQNQQQQDQKQNQQQNQKQDPKEGGDNKQQQNNGNQDPKKGSGSQGKSGQMTKEQAEKMLQAIQAQEAKVNDKSPKGDKDAIMFGTDKDW